jgi:hypothetical protein
MAEQEQEHYLIKRANDRVVQFDYYLLGLVFTILALGVQTASFERPYGQRWVEVSALALLLLSGIFGLARQFMAPSTIAMQAYLGRRRGLTAKMVDRREVLLRRLLWAHLILFIIGITGLMASRMLAHWNKA